MPNYKSKLERLNAQHLKDNGVDFYYEPKEGKIEYIIPAEKHTYTPDFFIPKKNGGWIIVETKGIWDYADRYKHAWIKRLYPSLDIRFVFTRSLTKTSKGARQTYADICEGRGRGIFKGLTWKYADKKVPLEWLNE
jgi:predicted nuclease of restriction endonuclease-like RecB superfamily